MKFFVYLLLIESAVTPAKVNAAAAGSPGRPNATSTGDINSDGVFDIADLDLLYAGLAVNSTEANAFSAAQVAMSIPVATSAAEARPRSRRRKSVSREG